MLLLLVKFCRCIWSQILDTTVSWTVTKTYREFISFLYCSVFHFHLQDQRCSMVASPICSKQVFLYAVTFFVIKDQDSSFLLRCTMRVNPVRPLSFSHGSDLSPYRRSDTTKAACFSLPARIFIFSASTPHPWSRLSGARRKISLFNSR